MTMAAWVVMIGLHPLHSHHAAESLQQLRMMTLHHRDMVRHAGMTQILEPQTRILFHARESIRGHQMPLGFDCLAFTRANQVFPIQSPKTKNGHWHPRPERGFNDRRLFDIEMS